MHGRGATAESILSLADALDLPDVSYLAPQAAGRTWYPHSFLTPIDQNEPFLTSALRALGGRSSEISVRQGVPPNASPSSGSRRAGVCLSSSSRVMRAATRPSRVSARASSDRPALRATTPDRSQGTPVFLGCSDTDSHIPLARVHESADVFRRLGALVDERIYPGMGHTINQDEIEAVRAMLGKD